MIISDPAILRVSPALLAVACPGVAQSELEAWMDPIKQACQRYGITGAKHVCAFIAQVAHESQGLTRTAENLNYTAARLTQVWPKRFPTPEAAAPYAHAPEKLANLVYAGRNGNGNTASGDGWRFRGGGPLQVTGRANWTAFAASVNMPLNSVMSWAATKAGGMMSAAWFWSVNGINALVDTPGEEDETKAINGGLEGLAARKKLYHALLAQFGG